MSKNRDAALTDIAAYEKKRKQQADTTVAAQEKQYAAALAAKESETEAGVAEAGRAYLDAVDQSALRRELDLRQVRERMANLGLTRSGANAAAQTAVTVADGNRVAAAARTRRQAVENLTRALEQYSVQNAADRATAAADEQAKALKDTADYRRTALSEADALDRQEETRQYRAASLAQSKARTSSEEQRKAEADRRESLKYMVSTQQLNTRSYAYAIDHGLSLSEALKYQEELSLAEKVSSRDYGTISAFAANVAQKSGTIVAAQYVARMYEEGKLTGTQTLELCDRLNLPYPSMPGYNRPDYW